MDLLRRPEDQTKDSILIVDDDVGTRKAIGEMLTRSGYSVISASDGESALKFLTGGIVIDLVIADYRMPGMDGLVLARRIRERMPKMPVVILTGHGDMESYLCAQELGVVRYAGKPARLHELLQIVRDAVSEGLCERTLREAGSKQTECESETADG